MHLAGHEGAIRDVLGRVQLQDSGGCYESCTWLNSVREIGDY